MYVCLCKPIFTSFFFCQIYFFCRLKIVENVQIDVHLYPNTHLTQSVTMFSYKSPPWFLTLNSSIEYYMRFNTFAAIKSHITLELQKQKLVRIHLVCVLFDRTLIGISVRSFVCSKQRCHIHIQHISKHKYIWNTAIHMYISI